MKHSHCNSSREKWGDFQLECMEGGELWLEGEAAICCDEKENGSPCFIAQAVEESLLGRGDMRKKLALCGQGESMAYRFSL